MVKYSLAEKLAKIATKQLQASVVYKQPRGNQILEFRRLYNNKTKQKLRAMYNTTLPVFAGFIDTLKADLDDPIDIVFGEDDPADYLFYKKVNSVWKKQAKQRTPNAMWNLKMRYDLDECVITGRGIEKCYSESSPNYKNYLEIVSFEHFHCQPKGGGILENHKFAGQSHIKRSKSMLVKGVRAERYYKEGVDKLFSYLGNGDAFKDDYAAASGDADTMQGFKGSAPDDDSNYSGEPEFSCAEWQLEYKGKRYYIFFDPFTATPLACDVNKDRFSTDMYIWSSWASHENKDEFWSKSYADDFYAVATTIDDLMSQELTNRAKQNMNARAFDAEMFPDVAKLDEAQWRADALVPVDTKGGTRKMGEGIYEFKTPELQGTVTLIDWLDGKVGKETGATDLSQGQAGKGAKANIQFANLQEAQKRISFKSSSKKECWQDIGIRFVQGLIDHMTEDELIEIEGADGFGYDTLKPAEVRTRRGKPIHCKIISVTETDKQNVLGKDQKIKGITMIIGNPELIKEVNPKWVTEQILRDVSGYDGESIEDAMDTQNYGTRDVRAEAEMAIRKLIKGKMPDLYYDADTTFINRILRFEMSHQSELLKKRAKFLGQDVPLNALFLEYIKMHRQIVINNMARMKQQLMAGQQDPNAPQQPGQPGAAASPGAPAAPGAVATQPAGHQRPPMAAGGGRG